MRPFHPTSKNYLILSHTSNCEGKSVRLLAYDWFRIANSTVNSYWLEYVRASGILSSRSVQA
ncbi:MAG: hypothetical protein ACI9X4_001645 [Glaciecola sp.]